MKSFLVKATPFLENILVGGAFCALGYAFFWTFNTSAVGILGMIAICYGGMKLLVGVIIYGVWAAVGIYRRFRSTPEPAAPGEATKEDASPTVSEATRPFLLRHWYVMAEVALLVAGLIVILIVKS